jgi:hypothetical protein
MPLFNVSQQKTPFVTGAALIVIIICVLSIGRSIGPGKVAGSGPYIDMARIEAEETANFLGDGKQVVVFAFATTADHKVLRKRNRTFIEALDKSGAEVIATEELGAIDAPQMPEMAMMGVMGVPMAEFLRIADAYPDADAIVSLVGVPYVDLNKLDEIPDSFPTLIVASGVSDMGMPAGPLLNAGILHMAIIPRYADTPYEGTGEATARELFEQSFQVVTATE